MNVIGIESSCDETSVAIISDEKIKANLISSQDFHVKYGGVVPELSSRAHLQIMIPLVKKALDKSKLELKDIDLVCASAGPGLIGALLVGLTFGKGLAFSLNKPFVPVDHIEGHIFSGFLMDEKPEFPILCLVVSGGHTLLLIVEDDLKIKKLGTTIDDAAGEAFDKVSKMLGLGYPGGVKIQELGAEGNPDKIDFPIAQCKNEFDFSFSGLKTAVLRYLQANYENYKQIPPKDIPDIAASFQKAVVTALIKKVEIALKKYEVKSISMVGGVAANKVLRSKLSELSAKHKIRLVIPDLEYCGDNAAMIALRGYKIFKAGKRFGLDYNAYPCLKDDAFTE